MLYVIHREVWMNNCNKIKYNSYKEAQTELNRIRNQKFYNKGRRINKKIHNNKNKRPNRVYKCDICGYWHLTSKK